MYVGAVEMQLHKFLTPPSQGDGQLVGSGQWKKTCGIVQSKGCLQPIPHWRQVAGARHWHTRPLSVPPLCPGQYRLCTCLYYL